MSFEHEDRFLLCVKGTSLIMIVTLLEYRRKSDSI